MKTVNDIRSKRFTRIIPKRCKFKLNEIVKLRKLDLVTNDALKRYQPGVEARIVGLQHNTNRHDVRTNRLVRVNTPKVFELVECKPHKVFNSGRVNFYYIKIDRNIYCVPAQHLEKR